MALPILPIVGGLLAAAQLRPGAWGDPIKAAQGAAPAGLLDHYSEEEQEEMGRRLQRQMRNPLVHAGPARQQFQQGLLADHEMRQAEAEAQAEAARRQQMYGLLEAEGVPQWQREVFLDAEPNKRADLAFGLHNVNKDVLQQMFPGRGPVHQAPTNYELEVASGARRPDETASTTALRTREGLIASYLNDHPDASRHDAVDYVDKNWQVITDPNGRHLLINRRTQEAARPNLPMGQTPSFEPTASVTEGIDASAVTGIDGLLRRSANTIADFIGKGSVAPLTAEAEADMQQWYQLGRLRLADAVTESRRSNMVLEMLDELFVNPRQLVLGTEQTRRRLETLEKSLAQVASEFEPVLADPLSSTERELRIARSRQATLNSIRRDIQLMLEGYGKRGQGRQTQPTAPTAATPDDINEILNRW